MLSCYWFGISRDEMLISYSIIDLQMEGSSGSPGPTNRKFK
jgi:hypothetical protein